MSSNILSARLQVAISARYSLNWRTGTPYVSGNMMTMTVRLVTFVNCSVRYMAKSQRLYMRYN